MAVYSALNVFKGPNAIIDYLHPDLSPPVPIVEIPDKLNPFREDKVRIYAKMLTALPAQNVKMLPALNMLLHQSDAANRPIVEASSGSTALSLGIVARALLGNEDVCAYVTNKKHPDSLRLLRFFGLKVSVF
jgi:cysteine synthase